MIGRAILWTGVFCICTTVSIWPPHKILITTTTGDRPVSSGANRRSGGIHSDHPPGAINEQLAKQSQSRNGMGRPPLVATDRHETGPWGIGAPGTGASRTDRQGRLLQLLAREAQALSAELGRTKDDVAKLQRKFVKAQRLASRASAQQLARESKARTLAVSRAARRARAIAAKRDAARRRKQQEDRDRAQAAADARARVAAARERARTEARARAAARAAADARARAVAARERARIEARARAAAKAAADARARAMKRAQADSARRLAMAITSWKLKTARLRAKHHEAAPLPPHQVRITRAMAKPQQNANLSSPLNAPAPVTQKPVKQRLATAFTATAAEAAAGSMPFKNAGAAARKTTPTLASRQTVAIAPASRSGAAIPPPPPVERRPMTEPSPPAAMPGAAPTIAPHAATGTTAQDPAKTPAAKPPPPPAPPVLSRRELVMALQGRLRQIGCRPGAIDGRWGKKGQDALERAYNRRAIALDSAVASLAALQALNGLSGTVCPDSCAAGQIMRRGLCLQKPRTQAVVQSKSKPVKRRTVRRQRRQGIARGKRARKPAAKANASRSGFGGGDA